VWKRWCLPYLWTILQTRNQTRRKRWNLSPDGTTWFSLLNNSLTRWITVEFLTCTSRHDKSTAPHPLVYSSENYCSLHHRCLLKSLFVKHFYISFRNLDYINAHYHRKHEESLTRGAGKSSATYRPRDGPVKTGKRNYNRAPSPICIRNACSPYSITKLFPLSLSSLVSACRAPLTLLDYHSICINLFFFVKNHRRARATS